MKRKFLFLWMIISAVLLTNCSPGNTPPPSVPETLPAVSADDTESECIETGIPETGSESENETDSAQAAVLPLGERLSGRYRTGNNAGSKENETYLEIYWINGTLIAEAEDTQAAYWAMELFPADDHALHSTSSDTVQVEAYTFSGFSHMGAYWDQTISYTILATEAGIEFTSDDGRTKSYIRDDTLDPLHIPERYREALGNDIVFTDGYVGEWTGRTDDNADVFLRLGKDGTILCLHKRAGEPVSVHIGLCSAVTEDGTVSCMTERIGWGDMPWFDTFTFSAEKDATLKLVTAEPCSFLPPDQTIILEKLNPESAQ